VSSSAVTLSDVHDGAERQVAALVLQCSAGYRRAGVWVSCKREITEVTRKYGGSISACHGASREGDVEYVPQELGGAFEVMKQIKRTLDPNNVMNPGKYLFDQAYE
jgi:FAD/FMN-containing dehydrogenase